MFKNCYRGTKILAADHLPTWPLCYKVSRANKMANHRGKLTGTRPVNIVRLVGISLVYIFGNFLLRKGEVQLEVKTEDIEMCVPPVGNLSH